MQENRTQVGKTRVRKGMLSAEEVQPRIEWKQPKRRPIGEHLTRNLSVAAALLICAVTLRAGALPELSGMTDVVLAAATEDSLLNDQLGRLSFVSSIFPEAALVFGQSDVDSLTLPVSGGVVVHAWSEAEPYMAWRTGQPLVTSASAGEVIGVYHGNGEERLVQVMSADGTACLYGNLGQVNVQTGDEVSAGDAIGMLMTGADVVFEVRRDGMSIDPALYLGQL